MNNNFYLNSLNEIQIKAVCTDEKKVLVLAVAGSGKTRMLVYKAVWLILEKKVNPNSILIITFTNKASIEIQKRIFNLTLNNNITWIGTFHSIANKILRINYKFANLSRDFQIIDNNDQIKIIKNIIQSFKLSEKIYNVQSILKFINKNKEFGIRENNVIVNNYIDELYLKIYKNYQKICNNSNLLDFSELIIKSYELLLNNKNILNIYKRKFKNILIDEFQDTNKIQYLFIKTLFNNDSSNIMIVGDDDQSIYSWRGADIDNINKFINDFDQSKIIYLEQNYRSTKNIIKAANNLISYNKLRSKKNIWTNNEIGNLIYIYKASNEIEEAIFISNYILNNISNLDNKTCAILYRNNYQSRIIEEYLLFNNLSYQIYGGLKFLDRQEIKQSIAYLKLIANHNDDLSYEKIVNFPSRKIGKVTFNVIKKYALENNTSYWNSSVELIKNNMLKKSSLNALKKFIELIKLIKNKIENCILPLQVKKILELSGLLNYYKLSDNNKYSISSKLDNINELINASQQFFNKYKINNLSSIQDFLSHILFKLDYSNIETKDNFIKLMTIHSSKGLEFDIIFIIGLEDGIFPSKESIYDDILLEEERRLAYVGITRAISNIIITYTKSRLVNGKVQYNKPSRFIKEISDIYIKYLN